MPSKGGAGAGGRTVSAPTTSAQAPLASIVAEALGSVVGSSIPVLARQLEPPAGVAFDVVEDDPPMDSPEWADLYVQATARYWEQRGRADREAAESAQLWDEFLRVQGEQVPEGERSLANNDALHEQLRRLARTAAAGEYERDNVIGDPNQTFGIEIEFDGADPNAVARALHDAGLSATPYQQGYHSGGRTEGMWTVERDATVTGEIVSPILRDTPETWAQLERVCDVLRQHGATVSARTGGHVHVGCDSANLDHDVNRFRRVARVCSWAEDLMYRLAAGSGRGRRHRGAGNGYRWCGPMRSAGQFEEAQDLRDLMYRVGYSHNVGLNYGNIVDGRRTIEYRYFDSSLDPARLQMNIKLACWITKRAAELPDSAIPRERVALGINASAAQQDSSDSLLRNFADLVFVRPRDRMRLYNLYENSAWQHFGRATA